MFLRLLCYDLLKDKLFYDRDRYEHIFHDPYSSLGKKMKGFIDACVILAVLIIIGESISDWGIRFHREFLIVDIAISLVFAGEYIYRFLRSKKKLKFILRPLNIIDALSFVPFFLGLIFLPASGVDLFKILRVFRLLRLYELTASSPLVIGFLDTLSQYKKEYKAIFGIFVSTLIVISTFIYYFERGSNPDFSSIPDALWWGIVTMTTVGF